MHRCRARAWHNAVAHAAVTSTYPRQHNTHHKTDICTSRCRSSRQSSCRAMCSLFDMLRISGGREKPPRFVNPEALLFMGVSFHPLGTITKSFLFCFLEGEREKEDAKESTLLDEEILHFALTITWRQTLKIKNTREERRRKNCTRPIQQSRFTSSTHSFRIL